MKAPLYRPGYLTLQFATERRLGSALIRYFGHGAGFSHVDVVGPSEWLLGARADGGVQWRPPAYASFTRTATASLYLPEAMLALAWSFLERQIGKPYDKRAILGFAADRDWREPDAWFCSELVAAALESCQWFPNKLVTPVNKLDPDDLALAISVAVPFSCA